MSFLTPGLSPTTRCISKCGIPFRSQFTLHNQCPVSMVFVRFKSRVARPTPSKTAKPVSRPAALDNTTMKKGSANLDPTKKASLLLNSLRKSARPAPAASSAVKPASLSARPAVKPASKVVPAPPVSTVSPRSFMKEPPPQNHESEDEVLLEIDAKEEAIQRRIEIMRRKVLWPGVWTLSALVGTYVTLAYLDVKTGVPSSDGSHLPERAQLPQNWYLTPTIILEGAKAAWNELDNLTIGIVVASLAIHLLKKSPLPIWEKLIHITGEAKWTAFTYPLINSSWTHAVQNMAALAWFLPGVVHYFDGDLFHTSAFLVSVPLITSYVTHFAYRFNLASGLVLNLGASGAIAAAFGVYCVAYAHEKVWAPPALILRLDAMYWGLIFAASQAYSITRNVKGGNRPAFFVHIASFGLGVAYAYFDLKHHLWIPLVSEISGTQNSESSLQGGRMF
ncbi:hypothetical protein C7974DRAFT_375596 [Boeremia exigua]|uniref:uncharacterized protein n=1 Tax=Boeremia exigua TaxID=749465 RepID=UPI001E8E12E1|nr:uncharacterized protein C7974DRAFT_375596 [Boeremia exigua]KAH6633522.1 hypothetical protein C7974DRAFT_375596 [Boeremia exigua]